MVAEKGYRETSTDDIAAQASISLSTFYAHFADKRDAVIGALEMSGAQITALAVPAARRAEDWKAGRAGPLSRRSAPISSPSRRWPS